LLGAERVVAIEKSWLGRMNAAVLALYELDAGMFQSIDPIAGYWISYEAQTPIAETSRASLVDAVLDAGAECRFVQDFWPLRDAVVASTVEFSIMRQANATPRAPGTAPAADR
jgi:hypothetical protein